jgi:hypothetical protein
LPSARASRCWHTFLVKGTICRYKTFLDEAWPTNAASVMNATCC